jgi:hypothetical protein
MKKYVLWASCGLMTLTLTVRAQTPNPSTPPNPANTLQQINGTAQAGELSTGSPELREDDHDLAGLNVVKTYAVPKTITGFTSQSVYWTDNAFLQKNSHVSAFGYSGRFGVSYIPYSTRDWTPSLTYTYQIIRYDRASVLDFEAMTLVFGSKYNLTSDGKLSITNSYSLQELNSPRDGLGNFYNESFLDNQLSYVTPISLENNLYFLGAAEVGWRLTDPGYYSRIDNSLLFSVIYAPLQQVRLQAYARPAAYVYTNDEEFDPDTGAIETGRSRTDLNVSAGVMATYSPLDELALNANLNWTGNYSNIGFREYQAYTPTLTLSGSYAF